MQLFESLFLILLLIALVRLLLGPIHPRFKYSTIFYGGLVLLVLGAMFEGWRWQMTPAYVAFSLLALATLKKSDTKIGWKLVGSLPLLVLLGFSAFLTYQLPVMTLPTPAGPYGVGTFDYSITDPDRVETYAPERNRELYVEVWYPTEKIGLNNYPVRTFAQELYSGNYDWRSFAYGYLKHIPTHSHIHAPIALKPDSGTDNGKFPVLLFNHGRLSFTAQNTLLMEHLASHGYVIFSIAHPYESMKVNLANAGTVYLASENPSDIKLPYEDMDLSLHSKIKQVAKTRTEDSAARRILLSLAREYVNTEANAKKQFITQAMQHEGLKPYRQLITEKRLEDYLRHAYYGQGTMIDYWVEDIQFIASSIPTLNAPIQGFTEMLDTTGYGVFGMSLGGAAAGDFCKIDSRCKVGANLDGTQFGNHWDRKVAAPFLMINNGEDQGSNDFAYLPPIHDFWDYAIQGSEHTDFVDAVYVLPLIKTLGLAGEIDSKKMVDIMNTIQLNFFDHYLKGKPIPGELYENFAEVVVRKHQIDNEVIYTGE